MHQLLADLRRTYGVALSPDGADHRRSVPAAGDGRRLSGAGCRRGIVCLAEQTFFGALAVPRSRAVIYRAVGAVGAGRAACRRGVRLGNEPALRCDCRELSAPPRLLHGQKAPCADIRHRLRRGDRRRLGAVAAANRYACFVRRPRRSRRVPVLFAGNGVSVNDATLLQKYLADFETNVPIGSIVVISVN